MCGIVGFISTDAVSERISNRNWLAQALFTGTLRGSDSTGLFTVGKEAGNAAQWIPRTFKLAMPGPYFVSTRPYGSMLSSRHTGLAIGHNRAATKGEVNDSNAHPFTIDGITLVHNGSLTNHKVLEGGSGFDVDSKYVTYSFAKFGVETTLARIRGAFALVWYDREDRSLNFVRNAERPLWTCWNKGKTVMYYTSERGMLSWLAVRNNIFLDYDTMEQVPEGKWCKMLLENPTKKIKPLPVEFVKPFVNNTRDGYWQGGVFHRYADENYLADEPGVRPQHRRQRNKQERKAEKAAKAADKKKDLTPPFDKKKSKAEYTVETLNQLGLRLDKVIQFSFLSTNRREQGRIEGFNDKYPEVTFVCYPAMCAEGLVGKHEEVKNLVEAEVSGVNSLDGGKTFFVYTRNATETTMKDYIKEFDNSDIAAEATVNLCDIEEAADDAEHDGPGKNVIPLLHGPEKNVLVSQTRFLEYVAGGCLNCGSVISTAEHAGVVWTKALPIRPVCPKCAEDLDEIGALTTVIH